MPEKLKPNNKIKDDKQPDKTDKPVGNLKKKTGKAFKVILIMLVVLILAATSFAVGIYLKFIDVQALAQKWKINEYPIVGKYFSEPKTNFEPVELDPQNPGAAPQDPNASPVLPAVPPVIPSAVQPEAMLPANRVIDDAELQKQAKIKQQEEAKRISKLARLYDAMKPDEAVVILNKMDDATVLVILGKMDEDQVAKIMPLFDAQRAALLSQSMLSGRSNN